MIRSFARPRLLALMLAACAGFAVYAFGFFPGAMSFDGAYQWWQARGGETSNIHAPAMTWLWRASDALSAGPGALFLLQIALLWGGLLSIAARLPWGIPARAAFVLGGGALPICWAVFSAVLSDALLAGTLCCAVGVLALPGAGRARFWCAVALLFAAVLLRKNAAPAALPLLAWLFAQQFRWRTLRSVCLACLATAAMQLAGSAAERGVDRHGSIFPALALWDLAAISIDAGEVLLPPATHGAGLDVADLAQAFEPFSCVSIFVRTRAGVVQPFFVDGDPASGSVREAWLRAIAAHPGAYLAHRARLARALFGSKPEDWPRELVFFVGEFQYRDNPPVAANTTRLNRAWTGAMETLRGTVAFAAWPYLLAALLALIVAWRRRQCAPAELALAVLGSGLLYGLPLLLIAPSAELRYLCWTCLSAYLGVVLAIARDWPRASREKRLTLPRAATTVRAPLSNEAVLRGPLQ